LSRSSESARGEELRELGFIQLRHCKGTDRAAFFDCPTLHQPKHYVSAETALDALHGSTLSDAAAQAARSTRHSGGHSPAAGVSSPALATVGIRVPERSVA
jgi:hypothetical protein